MTEPTPPPERPLPDDSRARLRADLLAHAHDNRSRAPRWIVPAGAAAAVALVAGMGYWAVSGGDDNAVQPAPVLGGGTSSAPATPVAPVTTGPVDPAPSTVVETQQTLSPPPDMPTVQAGAGSCEAELVNVLKGATKAFEAAPDLSFWVKGDQFSLCYVVDGSTTVTHPQPLTFKGEVDVDTYRLLSLYPPTDDGYRTVRAAGGVVPDGVGSYDVAYTFPDGHVEHSRTATDATGRQWWWMTYAYDDGGGNEMKKPRIQVVSSFGDFTYQFQLEWGVDTCAQANHGC